MGGAVAAIGGLVAGAFGGGAVAATVATVAVGVGVGVVGKAIGGPIGSVISMVGFAGAAGAVLGAAASGIGGAAGSAISSVAKVGGQLATVNMLTSVGSMVAGGMRGSSSPTSPSASSIAVAGSGQGSGGSPSAAPSLTYRTVGSSGGSETKTLVYGRTAVGGQLIDHFTTDNNTRYHRVYALCGHEIDAVEQIYFDTNVAWQGSVQSEYSGALNVSVALGTASQSVLSSLNAAAPSRWTTSHRCRGIPIVHLTFIANSSVYPGNALPNLIYFVVRGKKVLNLSTSTTAYGNNPAYCLYDYLVNYAGISPSLINQGSFITAASICNESVALSGGGTQSRYTCNGLVPLASTHLNAINELLTCMAGELVWSGGSLRLIAGAYQAPIAAIPESDLLGSLKIRTSVPRSERATTVRGTYIDPTLYYQSTDYPAFASSFLVGQYGEETFVEMPLPFTDNAPMAQRIAKQKLLLGQQPVTCSVAVSLKYLYVEAGDNITLSLSKPSWTNKIFRVVEKSLSVSPEGASIVLSLRSISNTDYAWSSAEQGLASSYLPSGLPSPNTAPAPAGFAVDASSGQAVTTNFGITYRARLTWTAPSDGRTKETTVEYKRTSDSIWTLATTLQENVPGSTSQVYITGLQNGVAYDFRIRHKNLSGFFGNYATFTNVTVGIASSGINGVTAVGTAGDLRSQNYIAGAQGWRISGNGDAEFNQMVLRGSLSLGTGIARPDRPSSPAKTDGSKITLYTVGPSGTVSSSTPSGQVYGVTGYSEHRAWLGAYVNHAPNIAAARFLNPSPTIEFGAVFLGLFLPPMPAGWFTQIRVGVQVAVTSSVFDTPPFSGQTWYQFGNLCNVNIAGSTTVVPYSTMPLSVYGTIATNAQLNQVLWFRFIWNIPYVSFTGWANIPLPLNIV